MIMKRVWMKLFTLAAAGGSILIAGCSSPGGDAKEKPDDPEVFSEEPDSADSGKITAENYARDFFAALRDNDYEKFHLLMAGEALKTFTPAHFEKFRAELGGIGRMRPPEYLGMLDNTAYRDYLWKAVFDVDGGGRKTGVFIFRLVRDRNSTAVAGIQFKRF